MSEVKKIRILVVAPGESPHAMDVPNTEEAFEEILGGLLQHWVFLPQRLFLIHRENAEEEGLPFNMRNPCRLGENIYGKFLLCGFNENSYISLTFIQQLELFHYFDAPLAHRHRRW